MTISDDDININEINTDIKDVKTISLKIAVFNNKGIRMKDKDFSLKFVKPDFSNIDNSKRFRTYRYNKYNNIFDKYYIPTIIPYTFITSDKIEPYKSLPKNTIIAFKKSSQNPSSFSFVFREYKYTFNKHDNNFNITYVGEDKKNINTYPFGGFNDVTVSYEECYEGCKFIDFDFDNIIMDMCISTKNMFYKCDNLINVKNLVLMKNIIQDMSYMFCFCKSLTYIDLSKCNLTLDVNKVKKMFGFCQNLKEVNIRDIKIYKDDYDNINSDDSLFKGCINLRKITTMTESWNIIKETLILHDYWIKESEYIAKLRKLEKQEKANINEDAKTKDITISKKKKEKANIITSTWINTFFEDIVLVHDTVTKNVVIIKK